MGENGGRGNMHVCLCLNIFNVQQCVPKTAEGFFFYVVAWTDVSRESLPSSSCREVWQGCWRWRSPAAPAAGGEEEEETEEMEMKEAAAAAGRRRAPAQLLLEKSTQIKFSL